MKANLKVILGCALALGLTTFATNKAQAVLVEDTLFTPLHVRLIVYYNDPDTGKIKKARITAKDIMSILGFNGDKLAIESGELDNTHVFIISKTSVVEDLTADDYLFANLDEVVSNETDSAHGAFKHSEAGTADLDFYSDGQDDADGGLDSDYWFQITGAYTYSEKGSAINSHSKQTLTTSLNVTFEGEGFDIDLNDDENLPISGSSYGDSVGTVSTL